MRWYLLGTTATRCTRQEIRELWRRPSDTESGSRDLTKTDSSETFVCATPRACRKSSAVAISKAMLTFYSLVVSSMRKSNQVSKIGS